MSSITQIVLAAVGAVAIVTAAPRAAEAQDSSTQKARWEFLVSSGTVVPTGAQRDAIKRGDVSAAQLSYVVRPSLAFTATLGWARSRDIASVADPKLDVYMYDLGAEARAPEWIAVRALTFSPFAGLGIGGRSYNHRSLDVDATHNVAAYGTAGGEIGTSRVRLRIEVRDYVTSFKPLGGNGPSATRNDVVVMAGLRLVRR
jgi:hypothetical protein